ncbi:MAG: phosphotransferase, partial [Elusimicrobiota bacterium]
SSSHLKGKQAIINIVEELRKNKIKKVPLFLKSKDKKHIINLKGQYWQLSEYVYGRPAMQPDYLMDSKKGKSLADFLIQLKKLNLKAESSFSIKDYIYNITGAIKNHDYKYYHDFLRIQNYLESGFFMNYKKIPRAFCHGDFHPLNVIWKKDEIQAVIDFEFFSDTLEMYDAANLVGCAGIENPAFLTKGGLVKEFMETIKKADIYSQISYYNFVDLIIASRFGWISEWFRKRDREMLSLETDYFNFLVENKKHINNYYKI